MKSGPGYVSVDVYGAGAVSWVSLAELAQLVERNLAKVEVAGSSPVFRSENAPVPL